MRRTKTLGIWAAISVLLAALTVAYSPAIYAGSFVTTPLTSGVAVIAQNIVTGATASVASFTAYTPASQGIYEVCGGFTVTVAGATGATLGAAGAFTTAGVSHGIQFGNATPAATTVGATNSGSLSVCQTILPDANSNIQFSYTIGGSPATNPTYTYWYTVIKK